MEVSKMRNLNGIAKATNCHFESYWLTQAKTKRSSTSRAEQKPIKSEFISSMHSNLKPVSQISWVSAMPAITSKLQNFSDSNSNNGTHMYLKNLKNQAKYQSNLQFSWTFQKKNPHFLNNQKAKSRKNWVSPNQYNFQESLKHPKSLHSMARIF